jgi:glycosyltransferase involved in cell wall biosynthesis
VSGERLVSAATTSPAATADECPLDVLFVTEAFDCGGAERQIAVLCETLVAAGVRCRLFSGRTPTAFLGTFESAGIEVVSAHSTRRFGGDARRLLAKTIAAERPDAVVAVGLKAQAWAVADTALIGIPCVFAQHAMPAEKGLAWRTAEVAFSYGASRVVACSRTQAEALAKAGYRAGRIDVVTNGVDTDEFRPQPHTRRETRAAWGVPEDAFVVGIVAGHRPVKRYDLFFDLIDRLARRDDRVYGVSVGTGAMLEADRSTAAAREAAGNLRVIGGWDDMPAAYSAMDCLVLVSDHEVLPMVILEAQACGVPVVSFDVGGAHELVTDSETGYLVRKGDMEALEARVTALRVNPSLASELGAAARRAVEATHSARAMAAGYLDVIGRALGPGGGASIAKAPTGRSS